ncbi:MAG: EAL domain-containing protein [Dehalococcoidia bacterium]
MQSRVQHRSEAGIDEAATDKVFAAETDITFVRLAVIAFSTVVYVFLFDKSGSIQWLAYGTLAIAWIYGVSVLALQPHRRHPALLSSYFTSTSDAALITAWIIATGGYDSPFYVLWYVSIVAIAYRYTPRETMIVSCLYAASYLALVAALGETSDRTTDLVVRIGYIFLVGAMSSLLSREALGQSRARVEARRAAELAAAAEARFRELLESAPDPVIIVNEQGSVALVNAEAERAFGYSKEDILGGGVLMLIRQTDHERARAEWSAYTSGVPRPQTIGGIDLVARRKDGSEFVVDVRLSPLKTEEGILFTIVMRDISERKRAEEALHESEARFRALTENASDFILILDPHGVLQYTSPSVGRMLGYGEDELLGKNGFEFVHPDDASELAQILAMRLQTRGIGEPIEFRVLHSNGAWRLFEAIGNFDLLDDPAVGGIVLNARDITERRRAEEALRDSETQYRTLVEGASDHILILQNGKTVYRNPAYERLIGYSSTETAGRSFLEFVAPEDRAIVEEKYRKRLRGEPATEQYEVHIMTRDGGRALMEVKPRVIQYHGEPATMVLMRDITERRQAEETIRRLAHHDALTGLPNRMLFEDRLNVALAQARRSKEMLAVLFLDLDRFKLVNDTIGHAGGDELLRQVAADLEEVVRDGDTVARNGGDEFTLLLPRIHSKQDAIEIAERILRVLGEPKCLRGQEFTVTTSIGISMYPKDGRTEQELMANADTAMYRVKERGRNNYQLYTPAMKADVLGRLALERDLRRALEHEEFVLHYQPILDVGTGEIVAAEALLRWRHPTRGLVYPNDFIPFAEEHRLLAEIEEWVLSEACRQRRHWRQEGYPEVRMSVNLSAQQLQRKELPALVSRILKQSGLAGVHLQIEITEGAMLDNADPVIRTLRHLRGMGVRISVDDFGTGYSSLSYLKRFPIDEVKIDRSFVRDLTVDPKDATIVSTIITMAHDLELDVVGEGVESEDQLRFLKDRGCDACQGYLFSKPVPAAEFEQLLRESIATVVGALGAGAGRNSSRNS